MNIQNDKEVAKELFTSIKEDTSKTNNLKLTDLYSVQLNSGLELISEMSFSSMGLKDDLLKSLFSLGIEKPSMIQSVAIPHILLGSDVAFHSKSGTGKTIAFVTGALNKIEVGKGPQVIIMTPTRELCIQVGSVVEKICLSMGIKICLALRDFVSELPIKDEEIVIGCPGKILGLLNSGVLDKTNISMIIMDEADELISNKAFGVQTIKLLGMLFKAQKIFFSATYSEISQNAVAKLAPKSDRFFEKNLKANKIQLYYIEIDKKMKIEALKSLFNLLTIAQTIIFVNTKTMVDVIKKILSEDGFSVGSIHGGMETFERDQAFNDFLAAKSKILVSTDLFSRGMDIAQVNLVINFDLPTFSKESLEETYIHRIGRCGRFNRQGFVIDFVTGEEDLAALTHIHNYSSSISKKFTLSALEEAFAEEDPTQ
jgi:ATP-dependent RNA helicase DDX19/DBP5